MCITSPTSTTENELQFRSSKAFLRLDAAAEHLQHGFADAWHATKDSTDSERPKSTPPDVENLFASLFRDLFGVYPLDAGFIELSEQVGEAAHRLGHLLRVAGEEHQRVCVSHNAKPVESS